MKSLILIPFLMIGIGLVLAQNNEVYSESRMEDSFHQINANGMFTIVVKQGNTQAIQVMASPAEYGPQVITMVKDHTLYIDTEGNMRNIKKLIIEITVPTLDAISLSGFSDLRLLDSFGTEDFTLNLNSQSKFKGEIKVTGSLKINVDGLSKASVQLQAYDVLAHCEGNSKLDLKGRVQRISIFADSLAKVNANALQYQKAHVDAQSLSKVYIESSRNLTIKKSKLSKVQ